MRPGDVTLLSLLSEKLAFSQKLGQAAGDGGRSHCPGLGDPDEEAQEVLWAVKEGCPLVSWVSRRAVSPWNSDNYNNNFMRHMLSTYDVLSV